MRKLRLLSTHPGSTLSPDAARKAVLQAIAIADAYGMGISVQVENDAVDGVARLRIDALPQPGRDIGVVASIDPADAVRGSSDERCGKARARS